MKKLLLYGVPFSVDIIAGLVLFLGRHSLASQGFDESAIRTIIFGYGIGYTLSSLLMTRLVKAHLARLQMSLALVGVTIISVALANTSNLLTIQVLYCLFPFMVSLFFNSYQIFMLNLSNQDARPLAATVGHFTFAWSMGFALGPFASGVLVSTFGWTQVYYLAALLALGILAIILLYKAPPTTAPMGSISPVVAAPSLGASTTLVASTSSSPSLVVPAWLGLLAGLAVWNTVLVFWPVQSVQLGISPNFRGLVEFSMALIQGFTALVLVQVIGWQRKPGWMLMMGAFGVTGLIVFGLFEVNTRFILGAVLFGLYAGSIFSLAVYHAMLDVTKAIQRVALNETFIGVSFLIAFPLSAMIHPAGASFSSSYLLLALLLALAVGLQALAVVFILRRPVPMTAVAD